MPNFPIKNAIAENAATGLNNIKQPFIAKLLPKLQSGGYLHLATDWEEYAAQMLEVLNSFPELSNTAETYAPTPPYRPETKFEVRGKRLGHGVWDLVFVKC